MVKIHDYLDGKIDVPNNGFNSDVEGLQGSEGWKLWSYPTKDDNSVEEQEDLNLHGNNIEDYKWNEDSPDPGRLLNICFCS